MKELTAQNGSQIIINEASFKDAIALKNSVQKALLASGIELKPDTDLMQAIFSLDSNEEVFKAIFKCLEKSLYGSLKITPDTFEDSESRVDYYPVVMACLEVNLMPFFKALISKLSELKSTTANALKQ